MTAPQGILRVHQNELALTFQVSGQATVFLGLPLRRRAEQYRDSGGSIVRVDLRRCTWMDSTFLGTLLLLFRATAGQGAEAFRLVSPSPQCRQILRQMGIDRICSVREEEDLPEEAWTEIERTAAEQGQEFCGQVLQAHQQLAALPGPTGESFRAVVRCVTESQQGRKTS